VNVGIITRNLNRVVTLGKRHRSKEQNDPENEDTSDDVHVNLLFDLTSSLLCCELRS